MIRIAFLPLALAACAPQLPPPQAPAPPIVPAAPYAEASPLPTVAGAAPVGWTRPDPAGFPDAEIVVLVHEEGMRHVFDAAAQKITTRQWFREVVYVRTEGGLSTADVVVPLGRSGKLRNVFGRTHKPDGRVLEVARSEVIEDEVLGSPGANPVRRALFALPNAVVGDVLEYGFELELELPILFSTFNLPAGVPVLRATLYVATGSGFTVHTRATGGLTVSVVPEPPNGVVYRAEGGPFLPVEDEPLAPNGVTDPPRFTFSMPEARVLGQQVSLIRSWGDVLEAMLDDAAEHFGSVHQPPIALPTDLAGKAAKLYEWTRDELAEAPDAANGQPRGWATVEHDRRATDRERSLYLHAQLRRAGIDVRFALARDRRTGTLDVTIVDPEGVDAMLLYVPSQSGPGVFLDPTCAACGYGDLPWFYQGIPTIVGAGLTPDGSIATTLVQTPILPSAVSRRSVQATFALEEDGNATLTTTIRFEGIGAARLRTALRAGRRANEVAAEIVADLCPRADTRTVTWQGIDERGAALTLVAEARVRGLAARSGDRLVVPLSPMSRLTLDPSAADERRFPVDIPYEQEIVEETVLELPEGFVLRETAPPVGVESLGATIRGEAPQTTGRRVQRTLRVRIPRLTLPPERIAEVRSVYSAYFSASNAMVIVGRAAPATTR